MMKLSLEINWQVDFTTKTVTCYLAVCDSVYSYHVNAESYYYPVNGQQIRDKEAPSHDQYNCHHCGKTFFSTLSFRHHLKVDHTELNELRYISCLDTFESIIDIQFHKSVHSQKTGSDGPYLCSMCDKTFGIFSILRSHERRVHLNHEHSNQASDMKPTCEECGKEFQFQIHLNRNMLKHGEKNFVCETCGKRYKTLYILKLHQRVTQKCDLMVARFVAHLTRGTGICCVTDRRFMGSMLLAQENRQTHSDLMINQRRDF